MIDYNMRMQIADKKDGIYQQQYMVNNDSKKSNDRNDKLWIKN